MSLCMIRKSCFVKSIFLGMMPFCFSINGMEKAAPSSVDMLFFDKTVVEKVLLPRLTLQSMGRLAQVCSKLQPCSFNKMHSVIQKDSVCCGELSANYSRCTKGLRYSAQQKDSSLFELLWSYHKEERKEELCDLYENRLEEFSLPMRMNIYCDGWVELEKSREKHKKEIEEDDRWRGKHDRWLLKYALKHGDGGVQLLHDKNIDIASLFPHMNESERFSILCKNSGITSDLLTSLAGEYITTYPAQAAHRLLKLRKIDLMLECIKKGIFDINVQYKRGRTVLHYTNYGCDCAIAWDRRKTCSENHADKIDDLLNMGADVNVADKKGRTVLHYACKYLRSKVVERLLQSDNVDIHKKDKKGKKAVDYATYSSGLGHILKADKVAIKLLLKSYVRKNT